MSETSEEGTSSSHPGHKQHSSKHNNRDAQCARALTHTHTHTHTRMLKCSHSLPPASSMPWGQSLSWGQGENQTPLWVQHLCQGLPERWAESTQDPQQLPQPQLKLAQLHSSANLPNLAGGCLSNRQPQFGKGG